MTKLQIGGNDVNATADEINILSNITSSVSEINLSWIQCR